MIGARTISHLKHQTGIIFEIGKEVFEACAKVRPLYDRHLLRNQDKGISISLSAFSPPARHSCNGWLPPTRQ
jgi:hypothetical protein